MLGFSSELKMLQAEVVAVRGQVTSLLWVAGCATKQIDYVSVALRLKIFNVNLFN